MKTISKTQVEGMTSLNGNDVPNQYILTTPEGKYFQSYNTIIAFIDNKGQVFLDENKWDYSRTTGKYRNQFLSENVADTRNKIKSGEYKLTNLNQKGLIYKKFKKYTEFIKIFTIV